MFCLFFLEHESASERLSSVILFCVVRSNDLVEAHRGERDGGERDGEQRLSCSPLRAAVIAATHAFVRLKDEVMREE